MKTKYTQGEWYAVEYAGHFDLQAGPFYGDRQLLTEDDTPREECIANAALACSAPNILESLQSLVDYLSPTKALMNDELRDIIERAEAAIEKATK